MTDGKVKEINYQSDGFLDFKVVSSNKERIKDKYKLLKIVIATIRVHKTNHIREVAEFK